MPPSLELAHHDALEGAAFHIVEATIDWVAGTTTSGWGRDRDFEIARWKAIHEAVERLGFIRLPEVVWAHAAELPRFIDPGLLVRYAPSQYDDPAFGLTPLDLAQPRYWARARPARGGQETFILADLLFSPKAFPAAYRGGLVTHACTSGFASADSLDDAILRATLELIERDAFMRHWFAQRPGHAISIESLPRTALRRFERLSQAGCVAGLQWLCMGPHPAWLAWAQHPELHFTSVGSASGLDGATALETALNELETQALARIQGVPPESIEAHEVRTPGDHACLYATPAYFRKADALWRTSACARNFSQASAAFRSTPEALYERLERTGHVPYWVDCSNALAREAIDGRTIHTVRAVVPNLIPMSFGHGRLPLGMDAWRRCNTRVVHPFA